MQKPKQLSMLELVNQLVIKQLEKTNHNIEQLNDIMDKATELNNSLATNLKIRD